MVKTRGVTKESDKRYRKKSQKGAAHAATLASSATATTKSTVPAPTDKRKASSKKQTAAPQLKKKAVPRKKAAAQAKKKDAVSEGVAVAVAVAAPTGTHFVTLDASTPGSPVRLIVGTRVAAAAQERSVGHVGQNQRYHKMLTKAFNSPEGHAFFDSNDNGNPAAVGQHSLAAFDKQPKENQGFDWDAALRNETDVFDGLDSDVDTVLDSLHLKKAAAPENISQHYEGFCDDPPPTTSSTSSLQFREIVSKTQMKQT